jgi:hypothetical protein
VVGDPDAALRIAQLETSEYYRRELTSGVATDLADAGAGRFGDALQAIDEQTLGGFIGSVARAHFAFRYTSCDCFKPLHFRLSGC